MLVYMLFSKIQQKVALAISDSPLLVKNALCYFYYLDCHDSPSYFEITHGLISIKRADIFMILGTAIACRKVTFHKHVSLVLQFFNPISSFFVCIAYTFYTSLHDSKNMAFLKCKE